MRWEQVKLGDIADITSSKRVFANQYVDQGVPFYRQKEIIEKLNKQDLSDPLFISEELYNEIKRKFGIPQKGDLLITAVGALGIPYLVDDANFYFKDGNLIWLKNFNNNICSNYLYYWIRSDLGQKIMSSRVIGSAQAALTIEIVKQIMVDLPPLTIQIKIVKILAIYDHLIDNNQKQIKLLEEAAHRLYKEWFVDLRFPGHDDVKIVDGVPEGWENTILDEVIEFNPSISLSKDRIKECVSMSALSTSAMTLDINEISYAKSNSGSRFQNNDTIMARITPCLENGKIAFVQELQSEEGAVGSTEYIVMRSKSLCPPMVYLLARTHNFRQYAINSMSGSDGRQRVKVERLREYEYLKPDATLIEEFSGKVTPFFKRIKDLSKANIVLQEARDRLLPKLMSGEIEV